MSDEVVANNFILYTVVKLFRKQQELKFTYVNKLLRTYFNSIFLTKKLDGWYFEKMLMYFPGDLCHPYEPFKCPGENHCISIQYLCDGAPDCADGYDEDSRLCTAGKIRINLLWWRMSEWIRGLRTFFMNSFWGRIWDRK